jgi:nickel-type superoxide dismutase maturation protease
LLARRLVAGRVLRITVEGSSMEPALAPGDRVLVVTTRAVRVGDIVAVPDPRDGRRLLVKRVISIDHWHRLISVEGDNRGESTDSREFGPVLSDDIVGRVVYRYAPSSRAGRVGSGR